MRQIKFRAWYKGSEFPLDKEDLEDYEKPQMIYNVQKLYDGNGPDDNPVLGGYGSFGNLIDNEEFVIQQSTGLIDKNGKEIYEGDVYRTSANEDIYQVFFYNGAVTGGKTIKTSIPISWMWNEDEDDFKTDTTDWLEVIGNIYESPELLNNE